MGDHRFGRQAAFDEPFRRRRPAPPPPRSRGRRIWGRCATITRNCAGITSRRSELSSPIRCMGERQQGQLVSSGSIVTLTPWQMSRKRPAIGTAASPPAPWQLPDHSCRRRLRSRQSPAPVSSIARCEVDGIHFGGGHLDAGGIGVLIEFATNLQTGLVVVAAINWTITWWLMSGFPRQLPVMNENRRCSILFHLLVPGGK